MATNPNPKKKPPEAQTSRARVLSDIDGLGVKAGQIYEAEKAIIDALNEQGLVDAHPEALAYAESVGAEVVQQPTDEPAAPAAETPAA